MGKCDEVAEAKARQRRALRVQANSLEVAAMLNAVEHIH